MTGSKSFPTGEQIICELMNCSIQRLADTDFRVFLDTLSRNRGEFLHACSARLSKFLEICNSPDEHGGYLLEELDETRIKDTPHDSAVLISMLDRSPEKSAEKLA